MGNITLKKVKDCSSIYSDGKSVLLVGRSLWLFRVDGTFVRKYRIEYAHKVAFLPGNMVLVHVEHEQRYLYISLETGDIVWSSAKRCDRLMTKGRFTQSPDGSVVYDMYYDLKGVFHVVRLEPIKQLHAVYSVKDSLRTSRASYCDERGNLHIIQTHIMAEDDPRYTDEKPSIYGILCLEFDNDNVLPTWEDQWVDAALPKPYGCDDRYILYTDLRVYDRTNSQWIDLLEKEYRPRPPKNDAIIWKYDPEKYYLTVSYLGTLLTVIVDCKSRKIVAQYEREEPGVGFQGCLINGEFWTGTKSGVVKLPFPHYDDVGSYYTYR